MTRSPSLSISLLAMTAALSACAAPSPGPNAAAAAAQQPADVDLKTKPTVGQEAGAVVNNQIEITFNEGSVAIIPEAAAKLDVAARLFRDANPTLMFTAGYSDARGEEFNNLLLSARRAEVVKRALVSRGIPQNRLLLRAYGVSDPADASNLDSPANRRVVITWRLV